MQHTSKFLTIVQQAKKAIHEIDVNEAEKMLQTDSNIVLIDVREDREWEAGHLPTAIHIGKGVIERDIEKQVPDTNKKIILYCGGGYRSALAAKSLQDLGYMQVYSMDGGFKAWVDSGRLIECE